MQTRTAILFALLAAPASFGLVALGYYAGQEGQSLAPAESCPPAAPCPACPPCAAASPPPAPKPPPEPPARRQGPPRFASFAVPFEADGVRVALMKETQSTNRIGSGYAVERAPKGVEFFLARFSFEETTRGARRFVLPSVEIRDSKGRTFTPASDLLGAVAFAGEEVSITGEMVLQPGVPAKVTFPFKVPSGALSDPFEVILVWPGGDETSYALAFE